MCLSRVNLILYLEEFLNSIFDCNKTLIILPEFKILAHEEKSKYISTFSPYRQCG